MAAEQRARNQNARLDWELDYAQAGRGVLVHYAWESAVGVAWQLIGWVAERVGNQTLTQHFMDEAWQIDPDRFDPVLAALAVAVLEQAWRQDSRPEQVTWTGIAAGLDDLADLRYIEPFCGDGEDDLRQLLMAASDAELARWASLAHQVLSAHAEEPPSRKPDSVQYRLEHCPVPGGVVGLLRREDRRKRDTYIAAATPVYLVRVTGTVTAGADNNVLRCPECSASTGLSYSSEAGEYAVTGRCSNDHTWPVPELSSRDLGAILARVRREERFDNPDT